MKITVAILSIAFVHVGRAWVSPSQPRKKTALSVHRRKVTTLIGGLLTGTLLSMETAQAELDYSKIQDLLGSEAATYEPTPGKRPTYLTEPTSEFLENESKASAFKQANLLKKKKFVSNMDLLATLPNDEKQLAAAFDDMRRQVKAEGGLPIGVTKDEVVKAARRRKSLKFWPTNVEIAYQDLLLEIAYQQSPNTDRDTNML